MAGQIIRRSKKSYTVRIYMGEDANGKRRYINKTVHGTRKDAQKYLNASLRDKDLGVFVEPNRLTLDEYLDKWLESAARPRVKERTADGYEGVLRRYIREPLGDKRLDQLRPLDIQKVYGQMQMSGLSALVVRHTHSALRNALKQAVKWGLIQRNPAEYVELPQVPRVERRVLSPAEAIRFIEASETMPYGLVFEFALLTGMRPEEYLALQWPDIDFKRCTATVQRVVVRHKMRWSFQEPKTSKSRRTIALPKPLLNKLLSHKQAQSEQRMKLGSLWEAYDLVFCSGTGSPLHVPNLAYRYFRPILDKAELPTIRLYDLRHTCATLLLVAEENPKVVSERLGHSTIVLTLDTYSHVLPTMQKEASAKLEKLLYKKARTQYAHKRKRAA